MLNRRYRRRAGPYAVAQGTAWGGIARRIAAGIVFLFVVYYIGQFVLSIFGVGNNIRHTAVVLQPENRGTVSVSLEGGDMKRADTELKLYPDDRVTTGGAANATLTIFDGSIVRMDENSDITIERSAMGEESSEFALYLGDGTTWISTPDSSDFSGTILRKITTPSFSILVPSGTEMVLTDMSVIVYDADGLGISLDIPGYSETVTIGEGQRFILPAGIEITDDPYRYRSPLDPTAILSPFVVASRALKSDAEVIPTSSTGALVPSGESQEILTVQSPTEGQQINTSTVTVQGIVSDEVAVLRTNGYVVVFNETTGAFSQELALSDSEEVEIRIEALDKESNLIAEVVRTVVRNREPPAPPAITFPAAAGAVYGTTNSSIEIRGTAAAGTAGIIVNDYRLQLFQPGNTQWSYLADMELGNFVEGENIFTVTAINAGGFKSEPVTLTIIKQTEGQEGIIQDAPASSASGQSSAASVSQGELPQNDPLMPGSLTVHAPSSGTEHTETTQSELLIEGNTPVETASVWVNDYRLQLYESGKDFWNYIASVELQTMKPGANTYRIVTRNAAGQILDQLTYTINYQPE